MHDPRTSAALRHVADLQANPPGPRWGWAVMRVDAKGRVALPRQALEMLASASVIGRWHRLALVLQPVEDPEPVEVGLEPDGRGRVVLPVWLRRRGASVLIGTDLTNARVVIAPAATLDAFGDVLAGGDR